MIFKKLILENYRQYKDIEFEFNETLNIIEAENGIGKSTFMSSIIFALYGMKQVINSGLIEEITYMANQDNIEVEKGSINFLENNTAVTLILDTREDETSYEIKRTLNNRRYMKEQEISKDGSLKYDNFEEVEVRKLENTHSTVVELKEIVQMIPENIAPLLFFDGERINSIESVINSKKVKTEFKDEIEKILNIENFELAKSLINRSSNMLNVDIVKGIDDKETSILQIECEELDEEIQKSTYFINDLKNKLDLQEEESKKYTDYLKTCDDSIKYQEKRELLLKNKIEVQLQKEQSRDKLIEMIWEEGPKLSSASIFRELDSVLNADKSIYVISGIEQKAINDIIKSDNCICGTRINNEMRNNLEDLKSVLPPESFESMLKSELANSVDVDDVENKYKKIQIEFGTTISKQTEIENELQSISEKITEINLPDVKSTEEKLALSIYEEDMIKEKINKLYGKIETSETILESKKCVLKKKMQHKSANEQELQAKITLDETVKFLSDFIKNKKTNIKDNLENKLNVNVNNLMRDNVNITLNSNLTPVVRFEGGAISASSGQNVMISLAYLLGLMQIAKEQSKDKHGYVLGNEVTYPIVMDGVTAKLDVNHTNSMVKNVVEAGTQVIFLANDQMLVQLKESILKATDYLNIDDKIIKLKRDIDSNITYKIEG